MSGPWAIDTNPSVHGVALLLTSSLPVLLLSRKDPSPPNPPPHAFQMAPASTAGRCTTCGIPLCPCSSRLSVTTTVAPLVQAATLVASTPRIVARSQPSLPRLAASPHSSPTRDTCFRPQVTAAPLRGLPRASKSEVWKTVARRTRSVTYRFSFSWAWVFQQRL